VREVNNGSIEEAKGAEKAQSFEELVIETE
jgi:hypothetical protein